MINPEKLLPPKVALILLIILTLVDLVFDPVRIIDFPQSWGGAVLFLLGSALMVWAHQLFTKHGTPVKHSQQPISFVKSGPYLKSRNPMYVGGLTMFLGLAVLIGTWPYFLFPVIMFFILNFIYIPWEEERMKGLFGEEFVTYLNTTRRWI